jgi:hypothetical protein
MWLESQLVVIDEDDFKFFPFLNSVRLGVLSNLPVVFGIHGGQESIVDGSKCDAAVSHENGFEQLKRARRIRLHNSAVSLRRNKLVVKSMESEWPQSAAAMTAIAMFTRPTGNLLPPSITIRASSQYWDFLVAPKGPYHWSWILVGNERLKYSPAVVKTHVCDDGVRPEEACFRMHIARRSETASDEWILAAANEQQYFGMRHPAAPRQPPEAMVDARSPSRGQRLLQARGERRKACGLESDVRGGRTGCWRRTELACLRENISDSWMNRQLAKMQCLASHTRSRQCTSLRIKQSKYESASYVSDPSSRRGTCLMLLWESSDKSIWKQLHGTSIYMRAKTHALT